MLASEQWPEVFLLLIRIWSPIRLYIPRLASTWCQDVLPHRLSWFTIKFEWACYELSGPMSNE